MSLYVPSVAAPYLMKELSTRLVMGKLAVDLSDEIPEVQWNGNSIAFPVYTRSANAAVIEAKGSVVPVEIDGSNSNAAIKHYAASVKWHRDTIRQSGGQILADMGLIDLAESMAQKLDADLVAECLSSAVLKSALAAADSMTQAELEAGFALFGDKQSVTEFGGVVLNSKLFPSLLAMDGFSSEGKTYTEAGNGIVLGQICGFYRGIPCYLSDNGTRPTISTTPESRVIILKKNALGYALKKAVDFDESYNNTNFYTTVTSDTYGAQKLMDTDKCVILGKTLSA